MISFSVRNFPTYFLIFLLTKMSGHRPPDSPSDMSDVSDGSYSEDEPGSTPDNPIPAVTYGEVLGR